MCGVTRLYPYVCVCGCIAAALHLLAASFLAPVSAHVCMHEHVSIHEHVIVNTCHISVLSHAYFVFMRVFVKVLRGACTNRHMYTPTAGEGRT